MALSILLVEDDEDTRSIVGELLRAQYEVRESADAEHALRQLEARPADLVLTDQSLPGKSGTSLAAEVKARWGFTRVYVVSGYDLPSEGPYDGVLSKPFDFERLLALLERISDERAHAEPAPSPH